MTLPGGQAAIARLTDGRAVDPELLPLTAGSSPIDPFEQTMPWSGAPLIPTLGRLGIVGTAQTWPAGVSTSVESYWVRWPYR